MTTSFEMEICSQCNGKYLINDQWCLCHTCLLKRDAFHYQRGIKDAECAKWISVKDRLPSPYETILITYNYFYVTTGFMVESNSFYEYCLIDFESERIELNPIGPGRVDHWMLLPEPPK